MTPGAQGMVTRLLLPLLLLPAAALAGEPEGSPPRTLPPQASPPRTLPPQASPPRTLPPQASPPRTLPPQASPPRTLPPQAFPPRTPPPQTSPPGEEVVRRQEILGRVRAHVSLARLLFTGGEPKSAEYWLDEGLKLLLPLLRARPLDGEYLLWAAVVSGWKESMSWLLGHSGRDLEQLAARSTWRRDLARLDGQHLTPALKLGYALVTEANILRLGPADRARLLYQEARDALAPFPRENPEVMLVRTGIFVGLFSLDEDREARDEAISYILAIRKRQEQRRAQERP